MLLAADIPREQSARGFSAHSHALTTGVAKGSPLPVIDDLFLRKLPVSAGEELADVLMSRYEKLTTIVTSNRPVDLSDPPDQAHR